MAMLALCLQREILEEGCHAVDLGDCNVQFLCNQFQILLAEVAVFRLHILQNRNQGGGIPPMGVYDLHGSCALRFIHCGSSPLAFIFRRLCGPRAAQPISTKNKGSAPKPEI